MLEYTQFPSERTDCPNVVVFLHMVVDRFEFAHLALLLQADNVARDTASLSYAYFR